MRRYLEGANLGAFAAGNRLLIGLIRERTELTWKHAGGAAGGVAFFWPVIGHWVPTALATGATVWTLTAIVTGHTVDHDQEQEEETSPAGPDTPAPAAGHNITPTAFLTALHQLLPDPKATIHLAQVAEHLLGDPTNTAPVRALCTATGTPVTRGVRVRDRGVSTGIRGADLPPLPAPDRTPSPTPDVAVVSAGRSEQQTRQQQQQHAAITPDPGGDLHRWIVHQPDRRAS